MISVDEKTVHPGAREARARRVAAGLRLRLRKGTSRIAGVGAAFWVVLPESNGLISSEWGMSLDETEEFLSAECTV